jgi:hypothetical protein
MAKQPWFKFYPGDWRADASLRMCSSAARLLWLEMLCLMHESEPRGHLLVKGRRATDSQLGMLSGITDGSIPVLLAELRDADVFSETDDGVIFSRKMVKDTKVSKEQSDRRKKGWEAVQSGNTGGIDPVKPKKPEARVYINDSAQRAGDDWPEGKSQEHARLICEAVSTAYLDLARSPGLIQSLGRLHAWRRDGASWEHDVLPVITGKMQGRRSPITTWAYFDQPIAESIAANRAALAIPEHDDVQRPDSRRANGHDARRSGALEALDVLEGRDPGQQGVGRFAEG